jgi:hypothetical protein
MIKQNLNDIINSPMDGELIAFYSLDSLHTSTTFVDKFPNGI